MKPIYRIAESEANGVYCREFSGLNIFYVNYVDLVPPYDPRIEVMRCLSRMHRCSSLLGYMRIAYLGEKNRNSLKADLGVDQYINVGLERGTFFSLVEYPNPPSWYVPLVGDTLWDHTSSDGKLDAPYLMERDALSLFVGGNHELHSKDFPAFTSEAEWLQFLTKTYDLVVVTTGDGYYIEAYARDPSYFELTEPALAATEKVVTSSEWYKKHASDLVWDEMEGCWVLPTE